MKERHDRFSRISLRTLLCTIIIVLLVFPSMGYSGQWRVAPARVFLDRDAKSTVLTVVNEGDDAILLQGKAMEWSQDSDGKDVYKETKDLIFFPRILTIEKGKQKIIRAGIKTPATSTEKTYRLFIEEIPQPKKNTSDSTQLTVTVRFGVPVFVKPLKVEQAGEVASASLVKGDLRAVIKNTGNNHFRISEISIKGTDASGKETFATKLNGWYLLAGASRVYSTHIPVEKCSKTAQFSITVSTDRDLTMSRLVNVDTSQCQK